MGTVKMEEDGKEQVTGKKGCKFAFYVKINPDVHFIQGLNSAI